MPIYSCTKSPQNQLIRGGGGKFVSIILFYNFQIFRIYFYRSRKHLGYDNNELLFALFGNLHEIPFHLVKHSPMHPHFPATFYFDFIGSIKEDVSLFLPTHLYKTIHLPIRHSQTAKAAITFPCDKLEVIVKVPFEFHNLLMRSIDKHQTMDDRYRTNDFFSIACAHGFLLRDEMLQPMPAGKQLFRFLLVLVGSHDIPMLILPALSICHTDGVVYKNWLLNVGLSLFYSKGIPIVHPDTHISLYINTLHIPPTQLSSSFILTQFSLIA